MKVSNPVKIGVLVVGDVIALYAALLLALLIRHGSSFVHEFTQSHLVPFSFIFPIWIITFYIAGLYDLPRLRNNLEFLQTLSLTLFVNAFITIAAFYLVPILGITPKTNLFIFIAIFAALESWWRHAWNIRASFREGLARVLLLDAGPRASEIHETLAANPQLGYSVVLSAKNDAWNSRGKDLREVAREHGVNLIVVPPHVKKDAPAAKVLYELLASGIEIRDVPGFYETVFGKVPLADLDESWFLDHNVGARRFSDDLKRGLELIGAVLLGVVLLPLELVIAILVKLTSPGPAIYRQIRIGKDNKPFTLYKFRTMREDAERDGIRWAVKGDVRTTPIGRFLRRTHLDELPQLWNVVRSELSFVGPRPERPEFVKLLAEKVPHYNIRHLVQPGVSGWAQINYRYGASVEDAYEKLQYDVYYLKNRSLILDLAIIVKTLKSFFVNQK